MSVSISNNTKNDVERDGGRLSNSGREAQNNWGGAPGDSEVITSKILAARNVFMLKRAK